MKYPGTITLTEETYRRLLTEICLSLQAHGFRDIVLIGDSGGNQAGMKEVAARLNAPERGGRSRVHFVPQYYDYPAVARWLQQQGIQQTNEGLHDDFAMTAQMMAVDPTTVRMKERIAADKFRINGVELAPAEKTIQWGKKIINFRAEATVEAIRKAVAGG
jgi:creatinine amidohydrolase/Fe(II)-dependent formamide hydrolase-like protein